MRKVRPDSVLQTLPEAKQDKIAEFGGSHSLEATVEFCGKDLGVQTSRSAVQRFLQWYETAHIIDQAKDFAEQFRDEVEKRSGGKIDHEALSELAQTAFELQAAKTKDAKLFIGLRRLRNSERTLVLERDKFIRETCELFLKWYGDKKAQKIAESDAPNATKIAQLRQTYFADVDELERSGEVQVPS